MNLNVNKISRRVITVEPYQDFASLIDMVREGGESRLYLHVLEGYRPLENKLNMRLIKNEGDSLGKEIIIVSENPQIRKAAEKLELPFARNLPSGASPPASFMQEARSDSQPAMSSQYFGPKMFDILPPDSMEPAGEAIPIIVHPKPGEKGFIEEDKEEDEEEDEKEEEYERGEDKEEESLSPTIRKEEVAVAVPRSVKKPSGERYPFPVTLPRFWGSIPKLFSAFPGGVSVPLSLFRQGMFFVSAAVILGGVAGFVYFVLPKAEIRLEPKKDLLTFDLAIRVDTKAASVDFAKSIVPGELLESTISLEESFIASGRETREEKAKGVVTIFNEYSSTPQTLVENTRFISQDGKLFRTAQTVVVPGATIQENKIVSSSTEVEVIAAEAGEEYNIGPSTFSIPGFKGTPKYTAFYGKSNSSLQGGFIGQVDVITAEDFSKAESAFRETLLAKAREDFTRKTPRDFTLLESAVKEEITDFASDKKTGDVAKSFTLRGKARVFGFVFDERDVGSLVEGTIEARIPPEKEILEETKKLTYKEVEIDLEGGEMTVLVGVEEWIAARINEEEIIKGIQGRSLEEVKKHLSSHPALESARVTFSPFWVKRVPRAEDKIKIEIVKTLAP